MIFKESNLKFDFDENWQVFRFDKHRFYRHLCSVGLKGIDFIGIYNNELLLLMEVKNYNRRKASPVAPNIRDLTGKNPRLVQAFSTKLEDSILAIDTVYKYYRRKFWYKIMAKIWRLFPFQFLKKTESFFWVRCYELLHFENAAHFVLWLETAPQYPDMNPAEIELLKEKIQAHASQTFADLSPEIIIAGEGINPYENSLKVNILS